MFKRELKINLKSFCIWCGILLAFFGVIFLVYPSLMSSDMSNQMNDMLAMFPPEMLAAFNMDLVGIESVFAWMQTEGYMFLTLLGGIYAALLGANILLKEENDKTIEFLYARPVSRSQIVTSRVVCGLMNLVLFTAVITLFNLIGLALSDELELAAFLRMSLMPLLLYGMLFSISLFLSTFLHKSRQATSLALGITMLSFLLQIIGSMGESTKVLGKLSLFEFVSIRFLIENHRPNLVYLSVGLVIMVLCIGGTYFQYSRKELV